MSNSSLQNARFEHNIISSLDTKLGELKHHYDASVGKLQTDMDRHGDSICQMQSKLEGLDIKFIDTETRMCDLEDDISACRKLTEDSIETVNVHMGTVETSLAKDIEEIRRSAEVKLNENQDIQRELENRVQDMAAHMENENKRLENELSDMKMKFDDLQNLVEGTESSVNSDFTNKCDRCSNYDENAASGGSVFSDEGAMGPENEPKRLNAFRSLIIDGVLEHQNENLAVLCLRFIREMGIKIDPDDIEVAFRLGRRDPKKPRPRPVKLVLNSELIRDQVYHFKKRLRLSRIFSSFQISYDLEKNMRVKHGILKRAATIARSQGKEVYSTPYRIKIEGVEYDITHLDEIPDQYRDANSDETVPKEPPLNIRPLTVFERARNTSDRAIKIGTGLQKTQWGLLFFSAGCFLSNFFKCTVNYEGYSFKSVEQGYQALMAKKCNRQDIFTAIMGTDSPSVAKEKTKKMVRTPEWEDIKIDVMRDLLFCKFRQNKNLYFKLLNTRPHALYECTLDNYWGTGCRLGSESSVDGDWCGQNKLGSLIMHVRDILVSELEENQMDTK